MDSSLQLHDIVTPENVSAFPLAIGWWFVTALTIVGLIVICFLAVRHYQLHKPRKHALSLLANAIDNQALTLSLANALLKRTAVTYCGRASVSKLYGDNWVQFLGNTLKKSQKKAAQANDLALFGNTQYQANASFSDDDIHYATVFWLNHVDVRKLQQYSKEGSHV